MSEKSLFWTTSGTGDGPLAGYTAGDFYNFLRRLLITDQEASQGVLRGVLNELAVSGSASPLSMATGAAIVYGLYYENTSPLSLAVGTPITGVTGGRVNLKVDWTAQTVRAVVQINTDGVSGIPALVQTAGAEWSISLATFTINQAGQVSLTTVREYCQFAEQLTASLVDAVTGLSVIGRAANSSGAAAAITAGSDGLALVRNGSVIEFGQVAEAGIADGAVSAGKIAADAVGTSQLATGAVTADKIAADAVDDTKVGNRVPQFYRRQGGDSADWSLAGSNNYTPGAVRMQSGIISVSISAGSYTGTTTITFPVAFSNKPLIFITIYSQYVLHPYLEMADEISATQFTLRISRQGDNAGAISVTACWLAIGPE